MSKSKLKKELQGMSREQLIEIIMNVYSARKEAKDYFEFFLNPDSEALLMKYRELIKKEVVRSKRGRQSKFRVSAIKAHLKDFEAFDPGDEYVLRLLVYSFSVVMLYSVLYYYTDTQDKAAVTLASAILDFGDRHNMFSQAAEAVEAILSNERGSAAYLRQTVRQALAELR